MNLKVGNIMVSVIMSVYNMGQKDVLKVAIESILNQTYRDIELIICDDGSNDNTYDLLQEFKKKDDRIKLLRNEKNMKASNARNRCLSEAKGDYIAIMDSDDYSVPTRIYEQVEFLNNNNKFSFVGVIGKYFRDDLEDEIGEYWFCKYPEKEDFLVTLPFVHASLMFRKEVLLDVKGYSEHKKVLRSEDYDMIMRMYSRGYIGSNIDKCLYYIRLDENTYKRRKYRYRINEMIVKFNGFRIMGLMPRGIIFALKPLIIGIIPISILNKIKNKYYLKKGI